MLMFRKLKLFIVVAALFITCSTQHGIISTQQEKNVIILYTNDEHGWLEPTKTTAGAPGLMGLWREKEGYTKDGPFLILSGGDMWTGPAISTWFRGKPMADVMNAMDYAAGTIGNHEFDFKIEGLKQLLANKKEAGASSRPPCGGVD